MIFILVGAIERSKYCHLEEHWVKLSMVGVGRRGCKDAKGATEVNIISKGAHGIEFLYFTKQSIITNEK